MDLHRQSSGGLLLLPGIRGAQAASCSFLARERRRAARLGGLREFVIELPLARAATSSTTPRAARVAADAIRSAASIAPSAASPARRPTPRPTSRPARPAV